MSAIHIGRTHSIRAVKYDAIVFVIEQPTDLDRPGTQEIARVFEPFWTPTHLMLQAQSDFGKYLDRTGSIKAGFCRWFHVVGRVNFVPSAGRELAMISFRRTRFIRRQPISEYLSRSRLVLLIPPTSINLLKVRNIQIVWPSGHSGILRISRSGG